MALCLPTSSTTSTRSMIRPRPLCAGCSTARRAAVESDSTNKSTSEAIRSAWRIPATSLSHTAAMLPTATLPAHRQLLPQIRFLKSFLDTSYSFRVLALRPGFTRPVLRQESPGALGFWVSPIFVELYASYCWEQSSSSSPGNIFLPLGLKFRFGLVWWHELGSESPVPCVSHGPLGG